MSGIDTHTNGLESFWTLLNRGYSSAYRWWSAKPLHHYVAEFTGHYNSRGTDTLACMRSVASDNYYACRILWPVIRILVGHRDNDGMACEP